MKGFFITATDTDAGKTLVASALIQGLRRAGLRIAPMKPVAAGAEATTAGLRNDDALQLLAASGLDLPYEQVNPYVFEAPAAPHLLAAEAGVRIAIPPLLEQAKRLAVGMDGLVVEGAGGWLVPLNERETLADLAAALGLAVILVVPIRLGCINHALLSAQAIRASGCELMAWVANFVDPEMACVEENIETLQQRLAIPCLARIPRNPDINGEYLELHLEPCLPQFDLNE